MGKYRGWVLLLISVVISVIAVIAGVRWANRQVENRVSGSFKPVVVASSDIAAGTRLLPEMLKVVDWPVASDVVGSASDPHALVDRVTTVNMAMNEPLLEQKLAGVGSKAGLSALIPPGMRAMTVRVNEIAGVAGFALPGNYVDVIVNVMDGKENMISKIVLQKILVLAVAQEQMVKDDVKAKVVNAVTLEVTPEQAEKLDLGRSVGNLTLVLRNQIDKVSVFTPGMHKPEMLEDAGKAVNQPRTTRTAPANTVEILRGTSRSVVPITH